MQEIRIVDLFAGIGGLRTGVLDGLKELNIPARVVYSSEIKRTAVETLTMNFPGEKISGDITTTEASDIPSHNLLLAGFPCQAFSYAGTRKGFEDETRGTLFFDVLRVLDHHKPDKFILENVEGLVTHDPDPSDRKNPIGRTLTTILDELKKLGYEVSWGVLNATDFGVPQSRRRVFITGSLTPANTIDKAVEIKSLPLSNILEKKTDLKDNPLKDFNTLLRKHYGENLEVLEGKIFRDWRGGTRNIHSWNIGLKGETTDDEKRFLEELSVESKKSKWGELGRKKVGEAYPLTLEELSELSGFSEETLTVMLDRLLSMKYVKQDYEGVYRISSGKLTFPVSHVLSKNGYSNTIVATDCDRLTVVESGELRRFTETELRRLFGFADSFIFPETISFRQKCDLFGNSVVVPVAKAVAKNLYSPVI